MVAGWLLPARALAASLGAPRGQASSWPDASSSAPAGAGASPMHAAEDDTESDAVIMSASLAINVVEAWPQAAEWLQQCVVVLPGKPTTRRAAEPGDEESSRGRPPHHEFETCREHWTPVLVPGYGYLQDK